MKIPGFENFYVPKDKVLARLGYASGVTVVDVKINDLIDEEIVKSLGLIEPAVVFGSSPLEIIDNKLFLKPNLVLVSQKLSSFLEGCTFAWGFAVTIGKHLEEKRSYYIEKKETTKALVLDAIGSESADYLAHLANEQIKLDAAKMNLKTKNRFSPGYGDLKLESQKDILAWLAADKIGIRLNNTFQMTPEKSVSAIVGCYS